MYFTVLHRVFYLAVIRWYAAIRGIGPLPTSFGAPVRHRGNAGIATTCFAPTLRTQDNKIQKKEIA